MLGEDADIVSIWNTGLASYTDQNWQQAIDMMEEALRVYSNYKNQTLLCIKQCEEGGKITCWWLCYANHTLKSVCYFCWNAMPMIIIISAQYRASLCMMYVYSFLPGNLSTLSSRQKKVLENYSESDPLIEQFVRYGLKGKCVRDCKNAHPRLKLHNPDPVVMGEFHRYMPCSYLHYAYYQVNWQ